MLLLLPLKTIAFDGVVSEKYFNAKHSRNCEEPLVLENSGFGYSYFLQNWTTRLWTYLAIAHFL